MTPEQRKKNKERAQTLAAKPPEERAAEYRKWAEFYREYCDAIKDPQPGELRCLGLAVRQIQSAESNARLAATLRDSCCAAAVTFGSCDCGVTK